jgi:predicted RNA-binding Zn ribbon-like protein
MATDRSFEFNAGSPALDFVDTVAKRASAPVDLLSSPAQLDDWLEIGGFGADATHATKAIQLAKARSLREAIYRSVMAVVEKRAPDKEDVLTINAFALKPPARPQLVGDSIVMTARSKVDAALSALAADAIERLSADKRDRLRQCPDCKMLFFDASPPRRRVWCSSSSGCGNRAKVRRHRQRANDNKE